MKSIFIAFDQAYSERIITMLTHNNCRGFSMVEQMQGRGSNNGMPHYGSQVWPSLNSGIITIVDDDKVDIILDELHKMDVATERLGLRAFVWNVEKSI